MGFYEVVLRKIYQCHDIVVTARHYIELAT
jgi:hypothetical protein